MVPSQGFALKHKVGDDGENNKADAFLDDLKLDKGEWTSVAYEADTNPILLAGIIKQYSKKAMAHEKAMTPMRGQ